MSGSPYNSVLRSGLTRRLWLLITLAMLIPVGLSIFSRWFDAEERRASQQNQELSTLSREKASTLLFNSRGVPENYSRGLDGRYLVVLDGAGNARFSSSPVPQELVELFERRAPHAVDAPGGTTILAWYASGREWRGATTYVRPSTPGDPLTANTVVVFAPEAIFGSAASELIPTALGLFALTILMAFAVAAIVSERYLPPLRTLQRGLAHLRERRFETLTRSAVEEFTPLEREFNATAISLQRDWRAFEVLGEVDRALLAASEIDRALDVVLPKFRELTRSHCVGVILLDPTAHAHGRLFMAALGADELPVQRVTFDSAMLATVREAPEGMTVARIEETRHAFLASMRDAGAEFFWLWPVVDEDRLAAMLVVGYHGEPERDPAVADYGAAFAERLRAALSNSARDERLYRQAHYDPLTQLPNRALFRDRLAQELSGAATGLTRGALMYVDLDHFKRVNDTLGHSAGDQLLSIVAHRLKACTKEGDTVARLGGDEFTVLLRNVGDAETARQIAERVIRSLALPANLGGRDYQMRASVGVTLFPDDGVDLEDIIRQADLAMYRAKAQGRGRAIFFERDMAQKRPSFTDSGLHRALRRRELSLFYQPQFSLADGRLCGAEALLRWQTRYDGIKLPGEFIPAAEHSGLITDIGGFVLDSACGQYAEWAACRHRAAHVLGQRVGAAAQGPQLRAHGSERASPARHLAREPRARARGVGAGGCRGRRAAARHRRARRETCARRFRHRLFVAELPSPVSRPYGKAGSQLPGRSPTERFGRFTGRIRHHHGTHARKTCHRGRRGNRGPARVPAFARLRIGAGLLPRAAHVRRRTHGNPRVAPAGLRDRRCQGRGLKSSGSMGSGSIVRPVS